MKEITKRGHVALPLFGFLSTTSTLTNQTIPLLFLQWFALYHCRKKYIFDVIKTAEKIYDLGPEDSNKDGKIIATSALECIAKSKASHTGKCLKTMVVKSCSSGQSISMIPTSTIGRIATDLISKHHKKESSFT